MELKNGGMDGDNSKLRTKTEIPSGRLLQDGQGNITGIYGSRQIASPVVRGLHRFPAGLAKDSRRVILRWIN